MDETWDVEEDVKIWMLLTKQQKTRLLHALNLAIERAREMGRRGLVKELDELKAVLQFRRV